MENNKKLLFTIVTLLIVILAACGNSNAEVNEKSDTELSDGMNDSSNTDLTENTATEYTDTDAKDTETNDTKEKVDASNNAPIKEESISTTNTPVNLKEEYLTKLSDAKKETDEMKAEDSSTYAMKKVENDRYDVWDELLNEVYEVLIEQLPTEEVDHLRNEQRNWIKYRDDSAKEASLKYKGGTQEHLEYVAVLANLTEERCYDLVENYMK